MSGLLGGLFCIGFGCDGGSASPADAWSDSAAGWADGGAMDAPETGASDGAGQGDGAIDGAARSPGSYAGVWEGIAESTEGGLPLHFVVNEEGFVTDLSVRLRFDFETGGWCKMNLHPAKLHPVVGDRAEVVVTHRDISFEVVIALRFLSETSAVMSHAGFVGRYQLRCEDPEPLRGDAEILKPNTGQAERVRGVQPANPAALKIAGPVGAPVQIGSGIRTCTHQTGRTGDVWCGYARWGRFGESELWVFNLTRLLAGEPIRCETDEPQHCQRLSESLWTGTEPGDGDRHPVAHGFTGDTLLFYAPNFARAGESFSGRIYAWRPGFSDPLQLAYGSTGYCEASERNDAVACLGSRRNRADGATFYDLSAGKLGEGKARPPKIATLLWMTPQESMDNLPGVLRRTLSPTGEAMAWSVRPDETPDAQETLYALPLGAAANTRVVLATGATRWSLSHDGTAVFFMQPRPGDPRALVGPLFMTDFPGGGTPRLIADNVREYRVIGSPGGPVGVVAVTLDRGLHFLPDARAPALAPILLDQNVEGIEALDPGHQRVAYRRWSEGDLHDLFVVPLAAPGQPCTLAARSVAGWPFFSQSGRYLVFLTSMSPGERYRLVVGDTQTCLAVGPSPEAYRYYRLPGDRFLVLGEGRPLGFHGFNRLSLLGPQGNQPFAVFPIADAAVFELGMSLGASSAAIYSVSHGWSTDGVYVLPIDR